MQRFSVDRQGVANEMGQWSSMGGKSLAMLEGHLLTAPIAGIVRNFTAPRLHKRECEFRRLPFP